MYNDDFMLKKLLSSQMLINSYHKKDDKFYGHILIHNEMLFYFQSYFM